MSYVFLFILLMPVKLFKKLFYKPTGKTLIIQTAKIGDFVNMTPLLAWCGKSDVLISSVIAPLAQRDNTIDTLYFIEQKKQSLAAKLRFAVYLMNRYEHVYLLQPNSVNLFFAATCNAPDKQFLSIYTRRWYHGIFYATAKGVVEHTKMSLTVTNYLKLADRSLTWQDAPKHATRPLYQPATHAPEFDLTGAVKIGLSISAGNKAKTIPPATWSLIFDKLASMPCVYYIFGANNEQPWLDDLMRHAEGKPNLVNMIGKIDLEDVPWAISQMDCYIASDSGNVYIADAVGTPVVLLYGPCCPHEQRPLGNVLLIGDDSNIKSFVFETRYYFDKPREELFALSESDLDAIENFVAGCTTDEHHSRYSHS